MSGTKTAWIPSGDLSESQQAALAVQASSKPVSRSLYVALLAQKIQQMVNDNPQEARQGMEMSRESAPGLWEIGGSSNPSEWGILLSNSDQLQSLLSRIDWSLPGELLGSLPETSLLEILETVA